MTLYRADNLALAIGNDILVRDVSFEIAAGECLALVGESGSGKSLTSLSPFGLTSAIISGSVQFEGEELRGATSQRLRSIRRENTGFVFQQPLSALTPHMTIKAHLTEAYRQRFTDRPDMQQLDDMLAEVGLYPANRFLSRYPHQLSGGERQRVMIACAIAHQPQLLIADEPVSALDAPLRAGVMALLTRLRKERAMAMLLVSHDLAGIERHADKVMILRDGAVVETGTAHNIARHPSTSYTRALWDAVPRLDISPEKPTMLSTSSEPLLVVDNLSVKFTQPSWRKQPIVAIDRVNLTIGQGEAVAMVGGSGSGKSTIGRAIAGIGPVSAGTVRYRGELLAIKRSTEQKKSIQPLFQDPLASLDPRWTIGRCIAEPLLHLRPELSSEQCDAAIASALDHVELSRALIDRLPPSLSGGQAQRVALARALVSEPELLVLDEATSALDPLVTRSIMILLNKLRLQNGLAMLFITHDLALAAQYCDRIVLLDKGRVVEDRRASALINDPQSDLAKSFIAASQ